MKDNFEVVTKLDVKKNLYIIEKDKPTADNTVFFTHVVPA